ncbi:hatching enzyme 1.2-like [Armigeres subalbatus]|uniref:hatching enzyme 1.2-like n=1 Tax=Armigeres subalbatus TaxID=124917 RepID=UPI002ED4BBAD
MYVLALVVGLVYHVTAKFTVRDLSSYGTALYRTIDPRVDELIRNLDPSSGIQPWQLGNLVGSDMALPIPKLNNALAGNSSSYFRWPNATVIYEMNGSFNSTELLFIYGAMREFEKYTCVRFKKRTTEEAYVSIDNSQYGCWADVGRGRGKTRVHLQPGCANSLTTPVHELMHSLGFHHEHNRLDRDNYIEVIYDHMIPDPSVYFNFQLVDETETTNFSVPYDIGSIMHYLNNSFSVKPEKLITLEPLVRWNSTFGQGPTLTKYDALLINIMYCGAPEPTEALPVPHEWIPAEPLKKPKTSVPLTTTLRSVQVKKTTAYMKMSNEAKQQMEDNLKKILSLKRG